MTQILSETYLDYSDILIKPKMGNNLSSRKDVNLTREYVFKRGQIRKGLGIFNANMATVGNFETAKKLLKAGMFATLHKFYTAEETIDFMRQCQNEKIDYSNLFISIGIKNGIRELDKLKEIEDGAMWFKPNICIDAPNFYIDKAFEVLKHCRESFPESVIMCGNIASSDICHKLLDYADILKVGIGSGCFHGDMLIQTDNGLKKIKDISLNDKVLTHTGKYQKVINKFIFNTHEEYVKINNIECTPNHKFFVCNKKDKDVITEENYLKYCFWVEAQDLDKETHLLLKIK